jgi:hypothetical protein
MKRRKNTKRAGDTVVGICVDCQQPALARDTYIVRGSIWLECGMGAWDAGHLHRECLEKRLGRELTEDDLLVWYVGETRDKIEFAGHPDYLTSPEYRPSQPFSHVTVPSDG